MPRRRSRTRIIDAATCTDKPLVPRRVVPDTRRRDTLIAVAAGAAVLAFVLYAVSYFSRQVNASGVVEGVIVSKAFVPGRKRRSPSGGAGEPPSDGR